MKVLDHMDRISELPDDLLLVILSLLPTKDVVTTMVLSKRWKFLWMFVPSLEYDCNMYQDDESKSFKRFIHTSLLLHKAPVIKRLNIELSQRSDAYKDTEVCVGAAFERGVHELCIGTWSTESLVVLPSNLYIGSSKVLVTLLLQNLVLTDSFSLVSLPSLKNLALLSLKYPNEEYVPMLLSGCSVLETMIIQRCMDDNVGSFIVRMASLKMLKLRDRSYINADLFLIDAPSLELLEIQRYSGEFYSIDHSMPKIESANVYLTCSHTEHILSSITSIEQLGLCLATSKNAYPEGTIFSRLVRLHLCTCEPEWLNLLMRMLKDCPNLRFLRLEQVHDVGTGYRRPCWTKPSHVPVCLLSSLETFEWSHYEGKEEEIEVARFILRNSGGLKMASFYPKSTNPEEKLEMLKELSMSPRCSPSCQLDFGRRTISKRDIFLAHRLIKSLEFEHT